MNIQQLQSDFKEFSKEWVDSYDYNEKIYSHCQFNADNIPILKNHFDVVTRLNAGFGEKAFRYFWAMLVEQLNPESRFLEIGIYKGSVISLIEILSAELNKRINVFGVSPLDDIGDKYSQYPKVDYLSSMQNLYQTLDISLDKIKIIKGLSTEERIKFYLKTCPKFDIIYIDGGHDYQTVCSDLELCNSILNINGFLVMDDASLLLQIATIPGRFKGHLDVALAINFNLENNNQYKHLFACGHNRVWQKNHEN